MAMFHFRLKSDKKPDGTKISAVQHVDYIRREGNFANVEQWEQKNIDWDLDLDTIKYFGDQDLLDLVWTNLLNNAIKFSPNCSKISISLKMISNQIQVIIIDEGIGMDEKTLQHCFEKFYQGDTSHSTKGNGLGLPLVKKIIELLEGTISIDSKPNLGTSITIILQKK